MMENLIENNRLIAEFMGFEGQHEEWCGNNVLEVNGLGFEEMRPYNPHSDWSDLMPVVEKISKIDLEDGDYAYTRTFNMPSNDGKPMVRINRFSCHYGETLIEATYKAVVFFIKWHNSQNVQPTVNN